MKIELNYISKSTIDELALDSKRITSDLDFDSKKTADELFVAGKIYLWLCHESKGRNMNGQNVYHDLFQFYSEKKNQIINKILNPSYIISQDDYSLSKIMTDDLLTTPTIINGDLRNILALKSILVDGAKQDLRSIYLFAKSNRSIFDDKSYISFLEIKNLVKTLESKLDEDLFEIFEWKPIKGERFPRTKVKRKVDPEALAKVGIKQESTKNTPSKLDQEEDQKEDITMDLKPYLKYLRQCEPPAISEENRYLLGPKKKSVVIAWLDVIEFRGFILVALSGSCFQRYWSFFNLKKWYREDKLQP